VRSGITNAVPQAAGRPRRGYILCGKARLLAAVGAHQHASSVPNLGCGDREQWNALGTVSTGEVMYASCGHFRRDLHAYLLELEQKLCKGTLQA
jgi:hypothetical protein